MTYCIQFSKEDFANVRKTVEIQGYASTHYQIKKINTLGQLEISRLVDGKCFNIEQYFQVEPFLR